MFIPAFLIAFFLSRRAGRQPAFAFPSDDIIKSFGATLKAFLSGKLIYLKAACLILVIISMARPQVSREFDIRKEGIGIVLAVDCSSTMLAEDLQIGEAGLERLEKEDPGKKRFNRLDAVKEVAAEFIREREDDWIGIVAFAADAYMACPLTFDHEWLLQSLDRLHVGVIEDGTAIGSAILSGIKSIKDLKSNSRVIVLLSDGINNAGQTPPLVAAKAARAMGIKIYTVGIVSRGQTPYPTTDARGRKVYKDVKIDVNEKVLKEIADMTGGQYFRVTDIRSLKASYGEIDKMEKVEIGESLYDIYRDVFNVFLWLALAALILEITLSNTILRKIP